tara:strand:- start:208 stop:486 length:279 start_codon:yes stop_codon:yes gene_type:complete
MTHYKIVNGSIASLTEGEVAALNLREAEWVEGEHDRQASDVRNQRNSLLSDTDWIALSDNTMSTEMAAYRQALRDVTTQEGFPYSVTWPTKP